MSRGLQFTAVVFLSLLPSVLSFSPNGLHQDDTDPSLTKYTLSSPDNKIKASWMPFGAALLEFFVEDKNGVKRDLVMGFDNRTLYTVVRGQLGSVLGRYAGRIRNGTFSVPPTLNTTNSTRTTPDDRPVTVYNVPLNDASGRAALHGGPIGYDFRAWNLSAVSNHSITFFLSDPDGFMGFPGAVQTNVTYSLLSGGKYSIDLHSEVLPYANGTRPETPIMLSTHNYWNLEGWGDYNASDPAATGSVAGTNGSHILQLDADRIVQSDGIEVATGQLIDVNGTPYDFRKPTRIGEHVDEAVNGCGTGCTGYDNCWLFENQGSELTHKGSLYSPKSGIRMDIATNQQANQLYACEGIGAAGLPRKASQGGGAAHPDATYGDQSCVALEQESWADGINQPEWPVNQIYGGKENRKYYWQSVYSFSVVSS
ncbi:galactose mutarotase-like protein [Dichomitus squalens]|uniref:Galactose mutarotase-like protein n=1 Tax=Dichomitus squalens TaxID=114155 RepID=A0A4Q9Q7E5_9APHY|nr:galactose mutarotase-like protein [Dichomitus squalens]TBU63325.1 galactose mutarotase-like protein [Dichomitus squalens]